MNFTKVHIANLVDLVRLWKKDDAFELQYRRLGHLNVKSVHAL